MELKIEQELTKAEATLVKNIRKRYNEKFILLIHKENDVLQILTNSFEVIVNELEGEVMLKMRFIELDKLSLTRVTHDVLACMPKKYQNICDISFFEIVTDAKGKFLRYITEDEIIEKYGNIDEEYWLTEIFNTLYEDRNKPANIC